MSRSEVSRDGVEEGAVCERQSRCPAGGWRAGLRVMIRTVGEKVFDYPRCEGLYHFCTATASGVDFAWDRVCLEEASAVAWMAWLCFCEDGIDGIKTQDRELSALCDVLQVYRVYSPMISNQAYV